MPDVGLLGFAVFVGIILIWIWNSLYIIKEWERGVVLRLGRLLPVAKGAGVRLVFWPVETLYRINLRLETLDVPPQDIITRDNVSVKVNAVCYFRVVDANLAMSQVQNYQYATSQLAQTTLRSIVGQFELDEILSQRDKVNAKLQIILDQDTEPWGISVQGGSKASRHSGTDAARHRKASRSGTRAACQGHSRPGRIRSVAETCRCRKGSGDAVVGNPAALPADFDGDRCREEHNDCFPLAHRYH